MADRWDKINAVQRMQDFIVEHADDEAFEFDKMYAIAGYSRRHADRSFKELLGKTPLEYLRSVRLSSSAQKLLKSGGTVLDIALESNFYSHEGYIRAFFREFKTTPSRYKKGKTPIPLFINYPVKEYYEYLKKGVDYSMESKTCLCMITPVHRPRRKLILLRSRKAGDYWSYCEEMDCEWEGLFNSIPSKFDTAAIITLPPALTKPGFSNIASGVEVPVDYDGELPENCETAELEPCDMLYFQSQPFSCDDEFFALLGELFKAVDIFDAEAYGYERADGLAPRFNFGGRYESGAKLAIPVRRIR